MRQRTRRWLTSLCPHAKTLADEDRGYDPLAGKEGSGIDWQPGDIGLTRVGTLPGALR